MLYWSRIEIGSVTVDSIHMFLAGVILVMLATLLLWSSARQGLKHIGRSVWPVARQVLGWICIFLGIVGMVLPVLQGVIFLALGVALLGRRNPVLRRVKLLVKRLLRSWSRKGGLRGWLGSRGLLLVSRLSVQLRKIRTSDKTKVQKA